MKRLLFVSLSMLFLNAGVVSAAQVSSIGSSTGPTNPSPRQPSLTVLNAP